MSIIAGQPQGLYLGSFAWANRPAGTIPTGAECVITNVGPYRSRWYWNGTRWTPYSRVMLGTLGASVSGTANTTEQVLGQFNVPQALIGTNYVISLTEGWGKSSNVDILTNRMRLGTAGTTADTLINTYANPSGTNTSFGFSFEFQRTTSATSLQRNGGGSTAGGPFAGASSAAVLVNVTSPNLDTGGDLIMSLTAQMTTGVEIPTLHSYVAWLN